MTNDPPNARQPRRPSRWHVDRHLSALDAEFDRCLHEFAKRRIFTGPSVYFYERTMERVRVCSSAEELAADSRFHEMAYATLTAWGMHRMGENVATKLTSFDTFRETLTTLVTEVKDLRNLSITDLGESDAEAITARLGKLTLRPGISTSDAPLVGNAKTLHFILPDLVPPIDRTYTFRFFFGYATPTGSPQVLFEKVFPPLHRLARCRAKALRELTGSYLCGGHAKALDNAIVGYLLLHPEYFDKPELPDLGGVFNVSEPLREFPSTERPPGAP